MNERIRKGVVASYAVMALQILSVLIYTPVLIHYLGRSDYAIYMLLNAFLGYFAVDFGLGSSLAKFITDCRYQTDCGYTQKELLSVVCRVFLLLSAILAVIFAAVYPHLDRIFTGLTQDELVQMKRAYQIAAAYFVLAFFMTPLEGIFTAYEYFSTWKLTVMLQKILCMTLSIAALLSGYGILAVAGAEAVSGIVTILFRIMYLIRTGALQISLTYWNGSLLKQILGFSVWMAVISFAQRFIIPVVPAVLGRFSDSGQIAVFSVASTLEGYIFLTGSVTGSLFLPQVSKLIHTGRKEETGRLQERVGRIQLFLVGAVILAFVDFGKEFIFLWAGSGYMASYAIVLLISLSDLFYITQQIAFSVLTVEGNVRYGAYVYVACALCSTVLSCLLAKKMGAAGAGIAVCICLWSFHIILMSVVYQKVAGMDMIRLLRRCHLQILPQYAWYGAGWLLCNQALPGYSWKALLFKGAVWTAGLGALVWSRILEPEEKGYVSRIWKQKRKRKENKYTDR